MTRTVRPRERGFALVIVLWTIGLLALLIAGLTGAVRGQVHAASSIRDSAVAEAAAEGAVHEAIFRLRAGSRAADAPQYRVTIGAATVNVAIEDQSDRINPNYCSTALMAALLDSFGVDPAYAMVLARRIFDWRTATVVSLDGGLKVDLYRRAGLPYGPADAPFASVEEIALVPGITEDIMRRLRPALSVWQQGDPLAGAGAVVGRSAVEDAALIAHAAVLTGRNSTYKVVRISATASVAGGTRFGRSAVVRLPLKPSADRLAWQILSWE
nr:type II secretion system protein GspK [uncultured Rhodopila sp.]